MLGCNTIYGSMLIFTYSEYVEHRARRGYNNQHQAEQDSQFWKLFVLMNIIFYLLLGLGFFISIKKHMKGLRNTTLLYVVIYLAIQISTLYFKLSSEKSMWVYWFFMAAYLQVLSLKLMENPDYLSSLISTDDVFY